MSFQKKNNWIWSCIPWLPKAHSTATPLHPSAEPTKPTVALVSSVPTSWCLCLLHNPEMCKKTSRHWTITVSPTTLLWRCTWMYHKDKWKALHQTACYWLDTKWPVTKHVFELLQHKLKMFDILCEITFYPCLLVIDIILFLIYSDLYHTYY